MPGQLPALGRRGRSRRREELATLGIPAVILFGCPEHKDAVGSEALRRRRHRAAGGPRDQEGACRELRRDHRRLPLRVHRPRPLRRRRATASVDNDATLELLARDGAVARAGRRRHGRAVRHDGRPRRRDPRGARRGRLRRRCRSCPTPPSTPRRFYGPFREAADIGAAVRRPPRLPDGPGQRARGAARGRARPRRGRRHRDGQAGAAPTSTSSARVRDALRRADRGLQRVSGEYAMVEGRGRARLDRRASASCSRC